MRRVVLTLATEIGGLIRVINLIVLIGSLAGCKAKPEDVPPVPAPTTTTTTTTPGAPHDGVSLLQPGTAPLEALRYHLTKGDKTTSELVWDFDAKTDGKSDPVPTLVFDLETTVEGVAADGTAKLALTVTRTSVRPRPGRAASELFRHEVLAMRGITLHELLAPDGQLSGAQLDTAHLTDAVRTRLESLTHSLELAAMRLPAEPVGATARWRERRTLPEGGIRAVAETTYTLTSRTGTMLTYTAASSSSGAPQTLEQDGLQVDVTDTRGRAEAKGAVDLAHYSPQVSATSSFTTAMNVHAPKDTPGAGPSTIEITMALSVAPAPPVHGDDAAAP
ncbi:MAG TPA: hypothetical protein VH165_05635 [Kofleriaceae bacterium]|jgi:hypothetical protein|nr:hypothetical protein [Kofleriaceae bacterium]